MREDAFIFNILFSPFCILHHRSLQEGRPEQRNLNDSAALAVKVAKKAEMKKAQDEEDAAKAAASGPVVRKKTKKKEPAGLDDLLSAGLSSGKGKKK